MLPQPVVVVPAFACMQHPGQHGDRFGSHGPLGLEGLVRPDDLRAVLSGTDPSTGEGLHRAKNRKVPGWDLTFRAPKSVSILWALGEPDTAAQVVAAHEAAVSSGAPSEHVGWIMELLHRLEPPPEPPRSLVSRVIGDIGGVVRRIHSPRKSV